MDATLIVIDSETELARARALVDRLWGSDMRTALMLPDSRPRRA
jgi:hypothetical protein